MSTKPAAGHFADLYRQKIGDLANALSDPSVRAQAAEAMRSLISEIRMIPFAEVPMATGSRS
ncbi:hypothetical protein EKE94_17195, partial [Mesobaculum littorinae]